jgi:hypothetical protein
MEHFPMLTTVRSRLAVMVSMSALLGYGAASGLLSPFSRADADETATPVNMNTADAGR